MSDEEIQRLRDNLIMADIRATGDVQKSEAVHPMAARGRSPHVVWVVLLCGDDPMAHVFSSEQAALDFIPDGPPAVMYTAYVDHPEMSGMVPQ